MAEEFESLDAIAKHFSKQRKDAGDDAEKVRDLELDEREARADFREKAAIKSSLEAHRTKVLAAAGIPEDFHEWVTGATPEEIDASAAKVKERVEKLTAGNPNPDADRIYGNGGEPVRTGGGAPPPPRQSDRQKRVHEAEVKINNDVLGRAAYRASRQDGRPGSQPDTTAAEFARYAQDILGRHVTKRWIENSQNPSARNLDQSKID
jgi:hypothetical protein